MNKPLSPIPGPEGLDIDKLNLLVRKYIWVVVALFLACNMAAYLTLRWTKEVYEASSELKLDIKKDATELRMKQIVEDENLDIIAGEIEQIKSKLFFSRVLDSLDLWVSYYSIGNVLEFEMYHGSPFRVEYQLDDYRYHNQPLFLDLLDGGRYRLKPGESGAVMEATLGQPLAIPGGTLMIRLAPNATPDLNSHYSFTIHTREMLLDLLAQNLKVTPVNIDANTIRISFTGHNPIKAYVIVNKIDSIYLLYSNEQKNMANKQKIEWLNKELAQVELKMENFENYFEDFTLRNKSSNVDSDLKKTIFIINQVDSQRFEFSKKIADVDALMEDISAGRITHNLISRTYLPAYVNARIEELQKIVHDKDRLTLSYKDNTYAFQQKEQEMNALKKTVFDQLTDIKKQWLKALAELNQKKEKLEKQFATMPDKSTQYSKNQRFYKLYEEFYLSMMQARAEFEIAQAGSTPDFKILSSAIVPSVPVSPKKYMILGIGLVGGLVFSLFFIGFVYLINNKVTGLQEIERTTDVPVLGVIPEMRKKPVNPFYIVDNPRSIVSEAIRTLRTNLDFFTSSDSKKVIVISSTVSGEGKSFLARNLGGVLALSKKKVILLDLDMRKAKENGSGHGDSTKGISTILINRSSIKESITKTTLEGFDFIPSGPHPPNPSELLLNGEFDGLLSDLRKEYDYIVIDTPPVGLVTDGIMAMKRADLSIYVVRANYSKRSFLKNLDRIVSINKLSGIAVVLNALPASGKTYGYGYYQEDGVKKSWIAKIFRN